MSSLHGRRVGQMKIRRHNRYEYSPIMERKPFEWPGGKRLAFYVALNVEDFSFGEGLGHTPTSLGPPPDPRNFAWRDYGLRVQQVLSSRRTVERNQSLHVVLA